jgi:hypothetical protein
MRVFQRLWNGEMLFKRDLALHGPSLPAALARANELSCRNSSVTR